MSEKPNQFADSEKYTNLPNEDTQKNQNELTAEWTVKAKLTISGPGEKITKEFTTKDPDNPVRVTCKWTNLDEHDTKNTSENFTDSGQCSPQKVCYKLYWQHVLTD